MTVPAFPYHPDPLATGSVEASETQCAACGQVRGFIYTGPVYAVEELTDCLCPWCIEDGSAAEKFQAEFTDVGAGVPGDVPPEVLIHVATRTPGFTAWQQDHWLYHCSDAAAFLGRVGWDEVQMYEDAVESLLGEHADDGSTAAEAQSSLATLSTHGDATAYLFRCCHCGRHLAYSDSA